MTPSECGAQAAAVAVARPATAPPQQQQQKVSSQGRLDAGRSQLDAGALLAQTPLTRVMQMQQPRLGAPISFF